MAIEIKHSLALNSNKDGIILTDTTGAYHVSTNPTGYGTPNRGTAKATKVEIEVICPDGTVYTMDASSGADFMPKNTTTLEFLFSDFGIEYLQDGVYAFTVIYTFEADPNAVYTAWHNTTNYSIVSTTSNMSDLVLGFGDCDLVKAYLFSDTSKIQILTIDSIIAADEFTVEQLPFDLVENASAEVLVEAMFKTNTYLLNVTNFDNCFAQKVAGISILELEDCENGICTPKSTKKDIRKYIEQLKEMNLGKDAVQQQFTYEHYEIANTNAVKLESICKNLDECC